MENLECRNSPDQLEQHYFCESCHVLSFWLFTLQIFNNISTTQNLIVYLYLVAIYISGLLLCVLSRCRVVSFVTET